MQSESSYKAVFWVFAACVFSFSAGVFVQRSWGAREVEANPPPTRAVLECHPDLAAEVKEQRAEIRYIADRALNLTGRLDTIERACVTDKEDGR